MEKINARSKGSFGQRLILWGLFIFVFGIVTLAIISKSSLSLHISGVVIPHHDMVKAIRESFMEELVRTGISPSTIILVSPNHFNAGSASIQTTRHTWNTSEGVLYPNIEVIENLIRYGVREEPGSFINEHGITTLVGEIKHNFPNAKIVPLILKRGMPLDKLDVLERILNDECAYCFLIASVDFSHYQPSLLANLHDVVSIRGLQNADPSSLLTNAEVDSPESLAFLALWANAHGTPRFEIFEHTNSGVLLPETGQETTTHLFGWYTKGEPILPNPSVTFTIAGDTMFARGIHQRFLENLEKSIEQIGDRLFWGTDLSIINLEGVISPEAVRPDYRSDNFTFIFPPESVKILRGTGINTVSLANNHTNNSGRGGLTKMREMLDAAGIAWLGGPGSTDTRFIRRVRGEKMSLAVIGVHALVEFPDITTQIRDLKRDGNALLVFVHWGIEYETIHNRQQERMAHDWIDAGADMVIGTHPHVIQDTDVYKGKPIIYSLGNFLFDQEFSPEVQTGIVLSGKFIPEGLFIFGLPVISYRYQPRLMGREEKESVLVNFYKPWKEYELSRPEGIMYFFPNKEYVD